MSKAFVSGCAGPNLTNDEIMFFRDEQPWGLILFGRNIETPDQVASLTAAFRQAVGRDDAPVLIDQEGGRVQRLKPPHWRRYPAPKLFGDLYDRDRDAGLRAAFLGARLIAEDLRKVGITIDCFPCLDVRFPDTVDAIGDRALSSDPEIVAVLGRAMVNGALAGGVLPVIKHIPGHGRAVVDSHLELPRVAAERSSLESVDFRPFKALSDVSLGMTAHIVYAGIDAETAGTQSARVVGEVIRGDIGFDGCLMSDDISMKALGGDFGDRSRKIISAGCDIVLHCNGDMDEMRAVANVVPELTGKAKDRCDKALSGRRHPDAGFDEQAAWEEFRGLTGWQGV
ncbi:beta-N-acetylhexosaminidase [Roseibium sediminicola]|uniref:beta-N-acetylhexosaminidase n=1 Tax=Roseibium sediminicola TaxID=2933272 RepID=A0ABT0GQ16_9HYPH|nr:beta-N-acetylhexosaminidase [Roseibium sp. CAU 1639]MCK7611512.1 beta-N-acetylhexosaminidase [Roseibium sp. CAU 1639]